MGTKTPPPIKKEVIRLWLKGSPRDQIAREIGIGAGTVSSIIKESKQNDPDFDLLREIAFIIKNNGLSLDFVASSIRLKKILEENGLHEEQIEMFIEKIEVHCFKRGLNVDEFTNLVNKLSDISDNLDVAINSLPEYISQKKKILDEIIQKVVDLETEKENLLEENKLTMDILLDYKKNRPVAEKLVVTQRELEKITRERDNLERETTTRAWKLHKLEQERVIPIDQLAIVNEKLDISTNQKEVDNLKYFRAHLGKYPDIIDLMREHRSYSCFDLRKHLKI